MKQVLSSYGSYGYGPCAWSCWTGTRSGGSEALEVSTAVEAVAVLSRLDIISRYTWITDSFNGKRCQTAVSCVMCVGYGYGRGAWLVSSFVERSVGAAAPCGPEPPCGAVWISTLHIRENLTTV